MRDRRSVYNEELRKEQEDSVRPTSTVGVLDQLKPVFNVTTADKGPVGVINVNLIYKSGVSWLKGSRMLSDGLQQSCGTVEKLEAELHATTSSNVDKADTFAEAHYSSSPAQSELIY